MERVEVEPRLLDSFRPIVGEETVEEIRALAEPLRGARLVHVNATAFGGGVAELLQTLVPLMRAVGLEAEWRVIEGTDEFFAVSKASHNGLQGMDLPLTEEMKAVWKRNNEANARRFDGDYDFVFVHDPQPAGLLHYAGRKGGKHWIWRCHIDTSHPSKPYWDFYAPFLNAYEAAVFTMSEYVGPGVSFDHLAIVPPSIDPLSPKNEPIPLDRARQVVARFGVDTARPLITQVSRFDPWKDPLGVIEAFRLARRSAPGAQLALVGSMARDDPEGWSFLDRTLRRAGEDPDIHVLHNFHGVGAAEVGAFQTVSDVLVQKSIREGFGLTVSEALWKGKAVIGGRTGGILLQIVDGESGVLVDSVEACGEKMAWLLNHPEEASRLGAAGREHVRRNFLSTRCLRDHLLLMREMV